MRGSRVREFRVREFREREARRGQRPSSGVLFSTASRDRTLLRPSEDGERFSEVEEAFKARRRLQRPDNLALAFAFGLPMSIFLLAMVLMVEQRISESSSGPSKTSHAAPYQTPPVKLGDCLGSDPGDSGFPGAPISCAVVHTSQIVGIYPSSGTDAFTVCDHVPLAHPGDGDVEVAIMVQGGKSIVACVLVTDPVSGSQMAAS